MVTLWTTLLINVGCMIGVLLGHLFLINILFLQNGVA